MEGGVKDQGWRSRAKRREAWLTPGHLRPESASTLADGAKYLLIANGAVIIATISGLGGAWHEPGLRPVFISLAQYSSSGFLLSIFVWLFASGMAQRLEEMKRHIESGNLAEAQSCQTASKWFLAGGLLFGMIDLSVIIWGCFAIGALLKAAV